jgi:hypothetical protein
MIKGTVKQICLFVVFLPMQGTVHVSCGLQKTEYNCREFAKISCFSVNAVFGRCNVIEKIKKFFYDIKNSIFRKLKKKNHKSSNPKNLRYKMSTELNAQKAKDLASSYGERQYMGRYLRCLNSVIQRATDGYFSTTCEKMPEIYINLLRSRGFHATNHILVATVSWTRS